MALNPNALLSLAELKARGNLGEDSKKFDGALERLINDASNAIEEHLGRRLVYRALEEVAGAANIVASVTLSNATLTLAAQPAAARTLIVTVTDADRSITAGTLTVTGTVGGVAGTTETFDLATGVPEQHGVKFFTAISSAVVSGLAGNTSADAIKIGSSLGYVEYHTPCTYGMKLWALERPLIQVAEVNEDWSRSYASTTRLTEGTDYLVDKPRGELLRLSASLPYAWYRSFDAVKVVCSAGYATQARVPGQIKDVAARLVITCWREATRGQQNIQAQSDAAGNFTRYAPPVLTPQMQDQLRGERRAEHFVTGRRYTEAA